MGTVRFKLLIGVGCITTALAVAALCIFRFSEKKSGKGTINIPVGAITLDGLIDSENHHLDSNPSDWEAYNRRARYFLIYGKFELARLDLERVIDNAPNDKSKLEAYRQLSLALMERKSYEDASDLLSTALESNVFDNAGNAELFEMRAAARFYTEQYTLALADCDKAKLAGNSSSKLAILRAMNEVKLQEWQAALSSLKQLSDSAEVLMLRSYALDGLNRPDEAAEAKRKAFDVAPEKAKKWVGFVDSGRVEGREETGKDQY